MISVQFTISMIFKRECVQYHILFLLVSTNRIYNLSILYDWWKRKHFGIEKFFKPIQFICTSWQQKAEDTTPLLGKHWLELTGKQFWESQLVYSTVGRQAGCQLFCRDSVSETVITNHNSLKELLVALPSGKCQQQPSKLTFCSGFTFTALTSVFFLYCL